MKEWSPRDRDESEPGAVGGPAKLAGLALGVDQLRGLGGVIEIDGPDLAFAEEDDAIAGGRYRGTAAFGDFAERAAGRGDPDGLLHSLRKAGGIRIFAATFEIAAADEHQRASVGRPGELGDFLAIVIVIIRKPAAGILGRVGEPDVTRAMFVQHPGDSAAFRRGSEIRTGRERSSLVRARSARENAENPMEHAARRPNKQRTRIANCYTLRPRFGGRYLPC